MTRPVLNAIAFYAAWAVTAYGAANGTPWLFLVAFLPWLPLHLWACGADGWSEAKLLATAGAVGYGADSALVLGGWLDFPPQAELGAPTTLWMVALWAGFAATLRHSMRWVIGHPAIAAALGAGGGPFSYWAGERLGALTLGEGWVVAVAVVWALALPGLAWLASRVGASDAAPVADRSSS